MADKKPQIEISDPYLDSIKIVRDRLDGIQKSFSWIMTFVVGVLLIGFLTMLFMVAGIVVDAWRYNSSAYKENTNSLADQQKMISENNKIEMDKLGSDITRIKSYLGIK